MIYFERLGFYAVTKVTAENPLPMDLIVISE